MTAPTYVQSASDSSEVAVASLTPTLAGASTAGNLLVLYYASGDNGTFPGISTPAGWTATLTDPLLNGGVPSRYSRIWHKISAGETSVTLTPSSNYTGAAILVEYDLQGQALASYGAVARTGGSGGSFTGFWTDFSGNGLEPTADEPAILGFGGADSEEGGELQPAGSTLREQAPCSIGEGVAFGDMLIGAASPPYVLSDTDNNLFYANVAAFWSLTGDAAPVADFTADSTSILEGGSVAFTDLSTHTPTSWAWDFGDGGTSTSQHPSHVFAAAGSYTITLTATNAFGSDDEVKTAYIHVAFDVGYEPPPPAGVLLEIYAASPGSARWDHAKWDEAVWSEAGWQDVTPQGIDVNILWGSNRPELGILSRPDADSWAISFFDPDRILDPANVDGPYWSDLEPGLPVRVSHRGVVIRTGQAESIGHAYADTMRNGYFRVTNNLSRLMNAQVPSDTDLSDTLYARAVDAIAAAGLTIRVLDPIVTDPAVSPWLTGVNEWTAWQWIMDAAEQVHYVPYINNHNELGFRPWAAPLSRGRSVNSPNLTDLQVITDYSGQFSQIIALDDDGVTIETRALTPPPRYGARTYERTDPTIASDTWADTVLADRALPGLRWIPGTVIPWTADEVEHFATIEAVELVSMAVTEQDPPVSVTAIVVGGSIRVTGKRDDEAVWTFEYGAAQTATEPLIESGGDPTDYLLATGGDQFLYPST